MRRLFFTLLAFPLLWATAADAVDTPALSIISGGYTPGSGSILLGLDVTLPDGWHTYWKSPGEGGFPPEFDISGSSNVKSFDVLWPTPSGFEVGGIHAVGYAGEVILPIIVRPVDVEKPVHLDVKAKVYACKDYCTAFDETMQADVAPGATHPGEQRFLSAWLERVPRPAPSGMGILPPSSLGRGVFEFPFKGSADASLFIATSPDASCVSEHNDKAFRVTCDPVKIRQSETMEAVLVAEGVSSSIVYDIPGPPTLPLSWGMLLTAFLGGLVLNFMPCVFPVLSLKLFSLTHGDARKARRSFAASSVGIVASFFVLGVFLSSIKLFGFEAGWGMQFQSPVFLAAMTFIVATFAFQTAGYFEAALPSTFVTRLVKATAGEGFWASFGQGFVATLLATPCTAPLVGTAVGFALSGPAWTTLAVFVSMGIGMATPYFAIAFLPRLSAFSPRPGRWMNVVKILMAVLLAATAGWLLELLVGPGFGLYVAVAAAVILAPAAIRRSSSIWPTTSVAAVILSVYVAIGSGFASVHNGVNWKRYDPVSLTEQVALGHTVFVYVTADWCLTCKVNERTVFQDPEVISILNSAHPMEADWTRPDKDIESLMKKVGRFGVPLTVVYSPSNPEGLVLPEILTRQALESSIHPKS